jgi:3-oxoacyl-[acyl-carrier protein] reductase
MPNELTRRTLLAATVAAPVALAAGAQVSGGDAPKMKAPKAAIVTGSSRGIGAATVKRLAREGYSVVVNCVRDRQQAADVVRDIEQAGGRAIWEAADVSDAAAVRRLFDACEKAFGRVDVVVSNAAIMRLAPVASMTDEDFIRMLDINQKGSFFVLREAARRVRDGGRIITLSSSITELRSPTYAAYAATKSAQSQFANILAKELAGRGISVNAVAPGLVETSLFTDGKSAAQIQEFANRTPLKRLGTPDDIAAVIAALCTDEGGWINGQTVFANGGIV